jgi:hypothetical protein
MRQHLSRCAWVWTEKIKDISSSQVSGGSISRDVYIGSGRADWQQLTEEKEERVMNESILTVHIHMTLLQTDKISL